jgi:hypothetical protein
VLVGAGKRAPSVARTREPELLDQRKFRNGSILLRCRTKSRNEPGTVAAVIEKAVPDERCRDLEVARTREPELLDQR